MQNFYFDLADSVNVYTLGALRALVPLDHLLFGSGVPFARRDRIELAVKGYDEVGLSDAEKLAIQRDNALRLFPRFQELERRHE